MIVPVFVLKLPASDWYLFLLVSAMLLVGIWLLIDEVLKWSKQRAELDWKPPSRILKRLDSIFGRYIERPPIELMSSHKENRSAAAVDVTPNKAA